MRNETLNYTAIRVELPQWAYDDFQRRTDTAFSAPLVSGTLQIRYSSAEDWAASLTDTTRLRLEDCGSVAWVNAGDFAGQIGCSLHKLADLLSEGAESAVYQRIVG